MKKLLLLGAVSALGCLPTLAETILSTDFSSHAVGAATESSLDAVTTDGTWTLGVGGVPGDLISDVSVSNGTYSLVLAEGTIPKGTVRPLASLSLAAAAGFSGTDKVTWSFDTVQQGAATSTIKNSIYTFTDDLGATVAEFRWRSNTGAFQYGDGLGAWSNIGNVTPASSGTTLDPDTLSAFSVMFSTDGVDVSLGGVTANITALAGSTANIGSFDFSIENTATANKSNIGSHFGDITVTTIPEPATLGTVIAFGGAILFIRRKLMM